MMGHIMYIIMAYSALTIMMASWVRSSCPSPFPVTSLAFAFSYTVYTGTFTMWAVAPETRGVRVRRIIHGISREGRSRSWTVSVSNLRTEGAVTDCSMLNLKEKVCKTSFDNWHAFFIYISHSPTLSRSTTGSGMILSTVSLTYLCCCEQLNG